MASTLAEYGRLLAALRGRGYRFAPVRACFEASAAPPVVYVRHDVDRNTGRALAMARLEDGLDVRATYYFRCDARARFPADAIRRVADLGHEVGFHYETAARVSGGWEPCKQRFAEELAALRQLADVATATFHGRPTARVTGLGGGSTDYLREVGLLGDPSIDLDYTGMLYVTDTGGRFGSAYNLRDKVRGRNLEAPHSPRSLAERLDPDQEPRVLLNCHPERWPATAAGRVACTFWDVAINAAKCVIRAVRRGEHACR